MSDDPPLTSAQRAFLAQMETPGSVLYGIFGWMSDSIMLARCRLIFMDLIADALNRPCEFEDTMTPCRSYTDRGRADWCDACCLADLAERIQRVTKP
jgi:hypothetical protein